MVNSGMHAAAGQMAWSLVGCRALCAGRASYHSIGWVRSRVSTGCKVDCLQYCN